MLVKVKAMSSQAFHLTTRQGLPREQQASPELNLTGSLDEVADELADLCIDVAGIDVWTTSVFDQPLTAQQQMALIERIIARLNDTQWTVATEDDDDDDSEIDFPLLVFEGVGWDRYGGDKLAFAADDDDGAVMIGIWDAPQTLLIGTLSAFDAPCGGIAGASTSHWHPGSATSGGYLNAFIVLTETVGLSVEGRDEDGVFMRVEELDATTPSRVAEILTAEVNGWDDLSGHGIDLMAAYMLGFSEGDVGLVGGRNTGYTIEFLHVEASSAVHEALQKMHPKPSPSEATAWLELAQGLCEHYDEQKEFVRNLTKIAQVGGVQDS